MPYRSKKSASLFGLIFLILAIPVYAASSSIALTVSANPATFSANVTLTGTVSPSSAAGSVSFYDGGYFLGSASLTSGTATIQTNLLPVGLHSLRAFYGGNASFTSSVSATTSLPVNALPSNGLRGPSQFTQATASQSFANAAVLADFNNDSLPDIAIATGSNVNILRGSASGSPGTPTVVSTALESIWGIAALDFNGDGKADLAIAGVASSAGRLLILLGNGDGTFFTAHTYASSIAPLSTSARLLAADFNSDGKVDLIEIGGGGTFYSFFPGGGDGTFGAESKRSPSTLLDVGFLADVNSDGKPDIIGVNGSYVVVYLGNGDSTFQISEPDFAKFESLDSVTVGDFNGDHKPDIAAATSEGIVTLLGNGDGTFQSPVDAPVNSEVFIPRETRIVTADLNNDGKLDLLTINALLSGFLDVYYGKGDGSFLPPTSFAVPKTAVFVLAADFNGDNRTDAAVLQTDPGGLNLGYAAFYYSLPVGSTPVTVILSPSPASSTLGASVTLSAAISPPAATGKVTFYDGAIDLGSATVSGGLAQVQTSGLTAGNHSLTARYLGDSTYGSGLSAAVPQLTAALPGTLLPAGVVGQTGVDFGGFTVGDFNSDGKLDIISASTSLVPYFFLGLGNGAFLPPTVIGNAQAPSTVTSADFNLDGKLDFATAGPTGVYLYTGNGDGSFSAPLIISIQHARYVVAADINSDGRPDMVVSGDFGMVSLINNGDGTFQPPAPIGFSSATNPIFADFNTDGFPDLFANEALINEGPGTFLPKTGFTAYSVISTDLNQDGKADLVVGNSDGNIVPYLGKGDGTFTAGTPLSFSGAYLFVAGAGDFDGDGRIDAIASDSGFEGANTLYLLKGNGDGTLQAPVVIPGTFGSSSAGISFVGDLNGDGRTDLILSNGKFAVLLGAPSTTHATTTALTASPTPVNIGQTFTLTATVSPSSATGTVAFYSGAAKLGTSTLTGGTAIFTPTLTTVGSNGFIALYNGDAANGVSFSSVISVQVNSGNSPVFPSATLPVAVIGQAYHYTFNVRGGTPPYTFGVNGIDFGGINPFNPPGQLNGTPTSAGTFNVVVTVTDHANLMVTQTFQLVIQTVNGGGPQYTGSIDSKSCAGISGWAADRARLNTSINVALYDGNTNLASVLANAARSDVGAALGDNGLHAFVLYIPTNYADGVSHTFQVRYDNTAMQLGTVTLTCGSTSTTPNYVGMVDSASCSGVYGWVADRNRLNFPIEASLWIGSTKISSGPADTVRSDVGQILGDNGRHGFTLGIAPLYGGGVPKTYEVHFENGSTQVGTSFTLTCGGSTAPTNYSGSVDSASCSGITGWVADKNRLNVSLNVSLWIGGTQLAIVVANGSRPDVGGSLNDNGLHAFTIQVPQSYRNGSTNTYQLLFESSAVQAYGSPFTLTCGSTVNQPNYAGYIDSATCSGITGWAADRNRPDVPILVSLWDGSTQIASTTANGSRTDVGAVLHDNGLHGFRIVIPAGYTDGIAHNLQIRYETSVTQLPGSPASLTCGSTTGVPNYAGAVDSASCAGLTGWAADKNRPNTSINVTLWDGNTQIASTLANGARPDVGASLSDNGLHGYVLQVPAAYQNGVSHNLQVRFESSTTQLYASPVNITCGSAGANYAGYIDSASCSGITGWAVDKNRLNSSINVTLWDGNVQIASTIANSLRSDVGAYLGDNGLHAFKLTLPSSYSNGTTHSLQVRYETSAQQLPGSPVSMTCGSSTTPVYAGYIESTSCSGVTGWAADKSRPNTSIAVSLWDGGTQLSSTVANGLRSDVGAFLGDNGLHAFTLPIPSNYANGVNHILQVRYESTATDLPGSPVTFTCGTGLPNYAGSTDVLGCTAITGWAADKSALNTPINVSVYDGSTLLTTVTANLFRPDLAAAVGDNGNHAFSIPTPAALKDGATHVVKVIPGSAIAPLYGPQSLTCH